NERQKYDKIEMIKNEKDPTKYSAKDSSGNVIKNSWVIQGDWYFFADADGVLLTGWQEIKGKTYYFRPGFGNMVAVSGSEIDGKYYNFNDDGSVLQSAWKEDQNGLHYSDASGVVIKEGLKD
ncbi:cell wall-binding protein, partial [Bacillus sp. SRB_8]